MLKQAWSIKNYGYVGDVSMNDELTSMVRLFEIADRCMIRLKHIYNFLCSMLVYAPFALCFVTLRGVFMHFPELTY
jgi:hypothetical protein